MCCTGVNVILREEGARRCARSCSGRSRGGEQRAPCPSWSMQMEPEEMQKLLQRNGGGGEGGELGGGGGERGGNELVRERERAVRESGWGKGVIKEEIEMSTRLNYGRIAEVMQVLCVFFFFFKTEVKRKGHSSMIHAKSVVKTGFAKTRRRAKSVLAPSNQVRLKPLRSTCRNTQRDDTQCDFRPHILCQKRHGKTGKSHVGNVRKRSLYCDVDAKH